MLVCRPSSKSGQAIAEIIPSIVIFVVVLMSGLSYYKLMRSAAIREEVVRNLAFAKIGNSGTLTTPPDQIDTGGAPALTPLNLSPESNAQSPAFLAVGAQSNPFVGADKSCFSVFPQGGTLPVQLGTTMLGINLNQVQFGTYAVVFRNALGSCP